MPYSDCIVQAYLTTMQTQWNWLRQLLVSLETHLKCAAEYHQVSAPPTHKHHPTPILSLVSLQWFAEFTVMGYFGRGEKLAILFCCDFTVYPSYMSLFSYFHLFSYLFNDVTVFPFNHCINLCICLLSAIKYAFNVFIFKCLYSVNILITCFFKEY